LWTLHNYSAPEPLILSCDEDAEVSIGDVARMIADAMMFSGDIVFDKSLPDGQFKKTASNARLRAVCGDTNVLSFTSLRKGIETTVQWFIANVENARR
jgi:GDP-L-fucose synthase